MVFYDQIERKAHRERKTPNNLLTFPHPVCSHQAFFILLLMCNKPFPSFLLLLRLRTKENTLHSSWHLVLWANGDLILLLSKIKLKEQVRV